MATSMEINKRGAVLTAVILLSIVYILYSSGDETLEMQKLPDKVLKNDQEKPLEEKQFDPAKNLPVNDDEDDKKPNIGEGVEYVEDIVKVKSIDVHYKYAESAKKDAPRPRFAVLLLHGAAFSSETWKSLETLKFLCESEYFPIAVDLPGYGKTKSLYKGDKVEFLDELISALNDLPNTSKIERPVIISPSMSGMYSVPFVIAHSNKLRGFIPIAPVTHLGLEDFKKVKLPTLVIYGSNDYNGKIVSEKLLNIPGSQKLEIANARHPAYIDDPQLFHETVKSFLDGIYNPKKEEKVVSIA